MWRLPCCGRVCVVFCVVIFLFLFLPPPTPPCLRVEVHTWSYSSFRPGDTKCCWCRWADAAVPCKSQSDSAEDVCLCWLVVCCFLSVWTTTSCFFSPLFWFSFTMLLPSPPGITGTWHDINFFSYYILNKCKIGSFFTRCVRLLDPIVCYRSNTSGLLDWTGTLYSVQWTVLLVPPVFICCTWFGLLVTFRF